MTPNEFLRLCMDCWRNERVEPAVDFILLVFVLEFAGLIILSHVEIGFQHINYFWTYHRSQR